MLILHIIIGLPLIRKFCTLMVKYQDIFQPVFDKIGFSPLKTFRNGPRFFVVGGNCQGERVIFKSDIEAGPRRLRKARWRMQREAVFLEHAGIKHIPKFYKKGIWKKFFWVLEGWVSGESQELGESTFLIRDAFFSERNLNHLIGFLMSLQQLGKNSPPQFEKQLPRYTLGDYMNLIWNERSHYVSESLSERIAAFLKARHRIFNANQTAIVHHELYGPHIFTDEGEFNVIDWENVGWGNPAYDFVAIWIRSLFHKDFQAELFERFRARQKDKRIFDELFRIEVVLQGVGNLRFFKHTSVPEEKAVAEKVSEFLRESIEQAVAA